MDKQKIISTFFIVTFAFVLLAFTSGVSEASDVRVSEILSNPSKYDGQKLTIRGEVVQFKAKSGDGYFVQLNDDPYVEKSIAEGSKPKGSNIAISVFLPGKLVEKIKYYGSYRYKGDIIEVNGTFNTSCRKHQGETDFHAENIRIIKRGYPIKKTINFNLIIVSSFLLIFSLALFFWWEMTKRSPDFRRSRK